ncbi:unnamed protein product [Paramecium pentaurelia]|uniref:Uncharacterized protein n=1 Tax=Paramecium pentaurelia TaxID=43138 RepID=A0A8S1SBW0_9CILI|nr:unnamed protein product [Paramecium pentaurelia]
MQHLYQQKQIVQNTENQIQREIQYYIYQDLENALCQLGQLEETIEQLEYQKDKSYLPIAMNKVILQANLSFGIHFDQYSQHNKTSGNFLYQCKTRAKSIFEEALNKKIIKNTHPKVKEICNFYLQNIFSQKNMQQYEELHLEKVQIESQFNQQALEKVIWGTQIVDKQLKQLQNQEYKPPTGQEIFEKIKKSKKHCEEQLKINFQNDLAQEQKQDQNKLRIQQEEYKKQTLKLQSVNQNSKKIKNQNQDLSQQNKINKVEDSRRTQYPDDNQKGAKQRNKTQGTKGQYQIIQKQK